MGRTEFKIHRLKIMYSLTYTVAQNHAIGHFSQKVANVSPGMTLLQNFCYS